MRLQRLHVNMRNELKDCRLIESRREENQMYMEPAQTLCERCSTLLRVDHTPVTCVWGSELGQTPKVIKAVVIPRRCLITKAPRMSQSCNPGESATSKAGSRSRQSPQPHQYGVQSRHLELKRRVYQLRKSRPAFAHNLQNVYSSWCTAVQAHRIHFLGPPDRERFPSPRLLRQRLLLTKTLRWK